MIINRNFKDFKFRHRSKKNQIIYTSKKVKNDDEVINLIDNFFIGFKIKDKHIKTFMKISSLLVLFMTLSNHIILLINDSWTLKSNLPIHLCSVSALICCFIGFTKKNQLLYEFLFYAGIIGGLLSILTPQITLYNEYYFFYIMFLIGDFIH